MKLAKKSILNNKSTVYTKIRWNNRKGKSKYTLFSLSQIIGWPSS